MLHSVDNAGLLFSEATQPDEVRIAEMPVHFPEDADRDALRTRQTERLRQLLSRAVTRNAFWQRRWQEFGVRVDRIRTLDDLPQLPLTTKDELVADQQRNPPYGSNLGRPPGDFVRLHQTSGTTTGRPLRWLDSAENWAWFMECWAQIYRIAGVRTDDRFCFPFSFGPFIGFWAAFEGASRLGRFCVAAGGMSSAARLQLISDNAVTVVGCTPTYALRLAEVAADSGVDLSGGTVRALIVAGEPGASVPAVRRRIESSWGARLFDHWGMTEIGSLAVECESNPGGMHVLETECIAEVIDPRTLSPIDGGTGELVITNLGRVDSPLIRYRTGDLVRIDPDPCPCGRHLLRLDGGILGRSDDMLIIRGNNVFPSTFEAVLREIPEVAEFRIDVVTRQGMPDIRLTIEPVAALWPDATATGPHGETSAGGGGAAGTAAATSCTRADSDGGGTDGGTSSAASSPTGRTFSPEERSAASDAAPEGWTPGSTTPSGPFPAAVERLCAQVAERIKTRLNFQPTVSAAPPNSLPRFEMKGRRFHRT